jgi:adenylyltransferase/sulfurtransferase
MSENAYRVPADLSRYSRQILYAELGEIGQRNLLNSSVLLVGCGALGTVLANTLVRAGVGRLRLCDRDFIERDNLQRQILFDEDDIARHIPKAEAAAAKLTRVNPDVTVEPVVTDVNYKNIESLADGADLLLDGTDNFETRFLINDLSVKSNRPWVYGAVIGASGLCMTILPGETPCLRCVFETIPPPELNPTCDTAGVLGSAVNIVASFQAIEAMKILSGRRDAVNRHLVNIDAWNARVTNLNVDAARDTADCPCCKHGVFEYLDGQAGSNAVTLCGRNAVQINLASRRDESDAEPLNAQRVHFDAIAQKLEHVATSVKHNKFLLRALVQDYEITLFPDGRAIIKGTSDPETARSLYARYIGA